MYEECHMSTVFSNQPEEEITTPPVFLPNAGMNVIVN